MTSATATLSNSRPKTANKPLNATLWVVQLLLAAAFLMAGFMKLTTPLGELAAQMSLPTVLGGGMTRFIGFAEVAGALGLVLPAATRIAPRLTPIAAAALALVMVLAVGYHLGEGVVSGTVVPTVFAALALFVLWGRTRALPIQAR